MSRHIRDLTVKRLAFLAILIAVAVVLNVLENMLPFFSGAIGGKIGLANIITMYAFLTCSVPEALTVGVIRSFLGGVLGGNPAGVAYSVFGTICSICGMWLAGKAFRKRIGPVGLSIIGAVCYNAGQLAVACLVLQSGAALVYLAPLTLISAFAGLLTGAAAAMTADKIHK